MHIVVRTDASLRIGVGHVVRCLTLGESLREEGASVTFVCRSQAGDMCDAIERRGFGLTRLPPMDDEVDGTFGREDAGLTLAAIRLLPERPAWIVVDHYLLGEDWERAVGVAVDRILVIDDLADRTHACDILLDQNLVPRMRLRYGDRVPETCTQLLGPSYALLQPMYGSLHAGIPPRSGAVRRLFAFFSGADTDNFTGQMIAAFIALGRVDITLDAVVTASNPHAPALRDLVAGHDNIRLHSDLPTLASLMAEADLAVGAGGATSWERMCLGLPSLVITLADNQRAVAQEMNERGLVRWLGHKDEVHQAEIFAALRDIIADGLDEAWSLRCSRTVDGKGALRVCAALTVTGDTTLRARLATVDDEALLLEWANDATTRRNAFSQEQISVENHRAWFHNRLRDLQNCRIYIVETAAGVPVGQARFDRDDASLAVDYALAPQFRGRGLGKPVLEAALGELKAAEPGAALVAHVKSGNVPSRRVFESLGFDVEETPLGFAYRRVLTRRTP